MTEKEKMLGGEFYDTRDIELRRLSNNAKDLMRVYNSLPAENMELRGQIIRLLFGFCGENARVNQPIWVDYGCNIFLGAGSLINMNCTLLDTCKITIGEDVLIGPDVKFYTAVHPILPNERIYTDETGKKAVRTKAAPITIGNKVWIGGGTVILPGVSIGGNTVIGAGSVVTESIPANTIAYGNPCAVRKLLDEYDESGDDSMPHIDITIIPGRDGTAKREIAVKVQKFLAKELNIEEKYVSVSMEDIEKENWNVHMENMKDKKMFVAPGV